MCSDAELRQTQGGTSVTTFALAVDRPARSGEERKADFIDIVCWGKTAEFASRYLAKGRMIVVDGRISTRNWEDKEGNKRKSTEVVADTLHFCGDKPRETEPQGDFAPVETEDDLPF